MAFFRIEMAIRQTALYRMYKVELRTFILWMNSVTPRFLYSHWRESMKRTQSALFKKYLSSGLGFLLAFVGENKLFPLHKGPYIIRCFQIHLWKSYCGDHRLCWYQCVLTKRTSHVSSRNICLLNHTRWDYLKMQDKYSGVSSQIGLASKRGRTLKLKSRMSLV